MDFEKIHRYLDQELAPDELEAFEQAVLRDDELANALETEMHIRLALQLYGDAELRRQIHSAHQNFKNQDFFEQNHAAAAAPSPLKITFMKQVFRYAAAAAVLLALGWFFLLRSTKPSPDEIVARYRGVKDPHIAAVLKGLESHGLAPTTATPDDSLAAALQLFDAGKFAEAQTSLKTILQRHPTNDTAAYYLGLAFFNQGHYAAALEQLQSLSTRDNFPFHYDARWTLGLCYLQTEGGEQKALQIFEALAANNDYPQHREAGSIIQMLSKH